MAESTKLPNDLRHVHLVGVCGTGMGTLAGMLRRRGLRVTGSDEHVYPPMSTQLEQWGIPILEGYQPENLPASGDGQLPDLVIIGNVCRRENPECVAVEALGLPYLSMATAIELFFLEGRSSLVVAGTHGKSTTTALLGHLLASGGLDPSVLVGALVQDFGGSFRLGEGEHFVIEGDEYDTAYFDKGPKFLHYRPEVAVLTNVEFDHADIFADDAAVDDAFRRFLRLLPPQGALFVCADDARAAALAEAEAGAPVRGYGLSKRAWLRALDPVFDTEGVRFVLQRGGERLGELRSPLGGEHNLRNALGAIAVALHLGLDLAAVRAGLASFRGLRKRQEVVGEADGVLILDDFAHHPTALRETLRAVAKRYPDRPIWALFEAKSNTSRLNVFQHAYSLAFDGAWHAIIAKPYQKKDNIPPERRLDPSRLVHDLRKRGIDAQLIPEVDEIISYLVERVKPGEIVLGMSGSAFGGIHRKLLGALQERAATRRDA